MSSLTEQFEGGTSGTGAEFSFKVTRSGNENLSQSIEYVLETSQKLKSEDFEENVIPSGIVVFAPNQVEKIIP